MRGLQPGPARPSGSGAEGPLDADPVDTPDVKFRARPSLACDADPSKICTRSFSPLSPSRGPAPVPGGKGAPSLFRALASTTANRIRAMFVSRGHSRAGRHPRPVSRRALHLVHPLALLARKRHGVHGSGLARERAPSAAAAATGRCGVSPEGAPGGTRHPRNSAAACTAGSRASRGELLARAPSPRSHENPRRSRPPRPYDQRWKLPPVALVVAMVDPRDELRADAICDPLVCSRAVPVRLLARRSATAA